MTETILREFPQAAAGPGVTRRVLAERPEMMVVEFSFEAGAEGAAHSHPHVQSTYVRDGRFVFTIAGREITVGAGDCFVIPSGAEHACRALAAGTLIDSFTPRRDEFL